MAEGGGGLDNYEGNDVLQDNCNQENAEVGITRTTCKYMLT